MSSGEGTPGAVGAGGAEGEDLEACQLCRLTATLEAKSGLLLHSGVMARTVEDVTLGLDAVGIPHPRRPAETGYGPGPRPGV